MAEKGEAPQSKILDIGKWDTNAIKRYNTLPHIQKQLRKGNWEYLNEHPEVLIIRIFGNARLIFYFIRYGLLYESSCIRLSMRNPQSCENL